MVPSLHAVRYPIKVYQIESSYILSYPLTILGNLVYSLATRFHLIPSAGADVEGGNYSQVPGTARAEAERRRWVASML